MQYWRLLIDRWKLEEGSAIVEMTLLMPFVLLLLMGTIDFARVFYTALAVTQAARAGAQYGAQNNETSQDSAGMQQAARNAAQDDIDTNSLTVTATNYCKCANGTTANCLTGVCAEGSPQIYVQVTTTKAFQTLWNYPGVPHTVNLNRTAIMRVQ